MLMKRAMPASGHAAAIKNARAPFALRQQARGRQRPIGDVPEREARFQARHTRKPRQLLFMDALEIGEIAGHDGDEIIVLARHQVAGNDGRAQMPRPPRRP